MPLDFETTKEQRFSLINDLIKSKFFDQLAELGKLMQFLNDIWPLATMPSTDGRFSTLEGDIHQHCVNNNDYDWTLLFGEKLDLYRSNDSFKKLIKTLLIPDYYQNPQSQHDVANKLNDFLLGQGYELILKAEKDGFKLYDIQKAGAAIQHDIPSNVISICVDKVQLYKKEVKTYNKQPKDYPAFVLASDVWDDYSVVSQYHLYFYESSDKYRIYIGPVKIIDSRSLKRA